MHVHTRTCMCTHAHTRTHTHTGLDLPAAAPPLRASSLLPPSPPPRVCQCHSTTLQHDTWPRLHSRLVLGTFDHQSTLNVWSLFFAIFIHLVKVRVHPSLATPPSQRRTCCGYIAMMMRNLCTLPPAPSPTSVAPHNHQAPHTPPHLHSY